MTTIGIETKTCAVCGHESDQQIVTSTNTLGSSDLDFRPPEMQRSTMRLWLMQCPLCDYVSSDLAVADDLARELIASAGYKSLSDDQVPLIARFLRDSMLQEISGHLRGAAHSALCAAWCADGLGRLEAAKAFRRQAIRLFEREQPNEARSGDDPLHRKAQLLDILRRSEQWDAALALCGELLARNPEQLIQVVVQFQRDRVLAQDCTCYTVDQACGASSGTTSPT